MARSTETIRRNGSVRERVKDYYPGLIDDERYLDVSFSENVVYRYVLCCNHWNVKEKYRLCRVKCGTWKGKYFCCKYGSTIIKITVILTFQFM